MGADVAELSNEAEDHVVLLVDRTLTNDLTVGTDSKLDSGVLGDRPAAASLLLDLWKFGEEEKDCDSGTGAGDGQVNILHAVKIFATVLGEKGLGGDEGSDEGGDTVPGLAELQSRRSQRRLTNDDGVRVGGGLESGKTAGNDQSASQEAAESRDGVVGV